LSDFLLFRWFFNIACISIYLQNILNSLLNFIFFNIFIFIWRKFCRSLIIYQTILIEIFMVIKLLKMFLIILIVFSRIFISLSRISFQSVSFFTLIAFLLFLWLIRYLYWNFQILVEKSNIFRIKLSMGRKIFHFEYLFILINRIFLFHLIETYDWVA